MKFRLLGQVEVEVNGQPVRIDGNKPALALAALLLAGGKPVTVQQLLDELWEGELSGINEPSERVHTCVGKLRGSLKRAEPGADRLIPRNDRGYRIMVSPEQPERVDLYRFQLLAEEVRRLTAQPGGPNPERDAEVSRLGREALQEWGTGGPGSYGESLIGLRGRWADDVRQLLRKQYDAVLLPCLGAELRLGRHDSLVPELEDRARGRPPDERIFRLLMRAHYRANDRPKALAVFENLRRRLAAELDTEPSKESVELNRRIGEQHSSLRPPSNPSPPGAAMPSRETTDLATRVTDVLAPALSFLNGVETPDSTRLSGVSWAKAKDLWAALHRHDAVGALPEMLRARPDVEVVHTELAGVLAGDDELARKAAAILAGSAKEDQTGQISITGPYFHQGDNISGTSIKYYRG